MDAMWMKSSNLCGEKAIWGQQHEQFCSVELTTSSS